MRFFIINPPHPAIGSRIPHEHLPPLGLLSIAGPLLDSGHSVRLLDAEFGPINTREIAAHAFAYQPDAVLIGHSGSTSGHPSVCAATRAVRARLPNVPIIYGGVYPTFHWPEIMRAEPQIDIIVRGEGEAIIAQLAIALERGSDLQAVPGIVFRAPAGQGIRATEPPPPSRSLDDYRVGWELIDHSRYSYYGDRRAVVVQFSRGCPHRCNYCGQKPFWISWRHRDPERFAAELARLQREHGVEVINFADENPTASRPVWLRFLKAMIAQKTSLILVGSTRADDIVRDADILHLYKQAGIARLLLGIESTEPSTLDFIRKDSRGETDRQAIALLRQHGIISMAAFVSGFEDETDLDYWRRFRRILAYDPDQIQSLYATPHRWTSYSESVSKRRVIQLDLGRWDYKHQVLAGTRIPPWRTFLWMKLIEAALQLRPRALWRTWAHPDRLLRQGMQWYCRIGRKVWIYEVWQFLFHDHRILDGPALGELMTASNRAQVERRVQPDNRCRATEGAFPKDRSLHEVGGAR